MRRRIAHFRGLALSSAARLQPLAEPAEPGVPEQLMVTIDTQQTAAPISKYLYGGFIEHGGTLMYRSLWSEMLDDRKFYLPDHLQRHAPNRPSHEAGRSRMPPRKWRAGWS